MRTSEQIDQLAAALAQAQAGIDGAERNSTNPHLKNRYADLSAVWDACKPVLAQHNLSVIQLPGMLVDGCLTLTTRLLHGSGQWLEETMQMPLPKNSPQDYGSALTYSRRYALSSLLGVCPADDDGNAASGTRPRQEKAAAPPAETRRPAPEPPAPRQPHPAAAQAVQNAESGPSWSTAREAMVTAYKASPHPQNTKAMCEWAAGVLGKAVSGLADMSTDEFGTLKLRLETEARQAEQPGPASPRQLFNASPDSEAGRPGVAH